MQFSIILAALAATASAQYAVNGTSTSAVAPYPSASGTVSVKPSGTGAVPTKSSAPFEGAASQLTGSAMGLIVAGGVALVRFTPSEYLDPFY
jgi:hypothetical protein